MSTKARITQLKKSLAEARWRVDWHREQFERAESDLRIFTAELARQEAESKREQDNAPA